jgi:hypothetical protein
VFRNRVPDKRFACAASGALSCQIVGKKQVIQKPVSTNQSSSLGKQLEVLVSASNRYSEFAALARAGIPSVVAIRHEVAAKFPEVLTDTTARQFCGAMVVEVMRNHGHEVIQTRGRADGVVFTYGAILARFR